MVGYYAELVDANGKRYWSDFMVQMDGQAIESVLADTVGFAACEENFDPSKMIRLYGPIEIGKPFAEIAFAEDNAS